VCDIDLDILAASLFMSVLFVPLDIGFYLLFWSDFTALQAHLVDIALPYLV